ncbi:MAG: DNA polymerase III subunit gamma/tau [Planctomycetes bacterium]|nr:DNA polymerase III subunit gamma/tau [Planctomycetota bacterium]
MAETSGDSDTTQHDAYVVVARRYRPQTFSELVGQEHIGQALAGAIASQRVGHAYLFTGARGVGKTSAARIFAKALNCVTGPTATPCNQCDICRSVSAGDDVDVLEIDGASNRGIDEIRQLRQNVNIRASRSRYKIYIIDEVHMLTREAFNALLKTLEEPPEHVKFIFCTTEAEKIPITILSRCQRFDFAGIQTSSIAGRLKQIVAAEGVEAEPEALEMIARRAAGSMRDSQSLLEQLLACSGQKLTADDVHRLLGTAADKRLAALMGHLVAGDAGAALAEFDGALNEGVDVAQLLDQLLGYLRDLMVAAAGCSPDTFLYVGRNDQSQVIASAQQLGLETILACMQIVDGALARMRHSTRPRTLAELALVRIARLGNLEELAGLLTQLRQSSGDLTLPAATRTAAPQITAASTTRTNVSAPVEAKKKELSDDAPAAASRSLSEARPTSEVRPAPEGQILRVDTPTAAARQSDAVAEDEPSAPAPDAIEITSDNVLALWQQAIGQLAGMVVDHALSADRVAILAPNRLAVHFPAGYTTSKSFCERPEQLAQIERSLQAITGQAVRVEFSVSTATAEPKPEVERARIVSPRERMYEKMSNPLVQRAADLFDIRPLRID